MKRIWSILILLLSSHQLPAQIDTNAIDKIFNRDGAEGLPGLVVGIWQKNEMVYQHSSGLADLEHSARVTPNTPFHIGFLTQQFIEYAIGQLIEAGKLKATDPVTQHVSGLPAVYRKVQIQHLLNHTSGVLDYWALRVLAGWGYDDPMNTAQAMEMVRGIDQLNQEPGEKELYANTNPLLLARVIEKLSGMTICSYLHNHIFKPLGMKTAFASQDHTALISNRAKAYLNDGKAWKATYSHHPDLGAAGAYTSLEDLHKWLVHIGKRSESQYPNLWKTQNYQGHDYEYRTAFYFGYRGFMARFGDGYSIIILSADFYLNSWNQVMSVMGVLNPGESNDTASQTEEKTYSKSFDPKLYIGDYWDPTEFHSRSVRYENDSLYYVTPDGWQSALEPVGEHEFKMLQSSSGRHVWFDPSGLEPMMAVGNSIEDAYRYYEYDAANPTEIDLKALAGSYYLPALKAQYELYVEEGKLYAKHFRAPALLLHPLDKDRFANEEEWYFSMISINRNSQGEVRGFTLNTPELTGLFFHKIDLPK